MAATDQTRILSLYEQVSYTSDTGGDVPTDRTGGLNLGTALNIPRGRVFSTFVQSHRRAAKDLCDVLMRTSSPIQLIELAGRLRDRLNENLFIYAVSFVILHKQEFRNLRLPSIVEVFPHKFVPAEELTKMQVTVNKLPPNQEAQLVIEYGPEFASTNLKPEHRVSYWREDYGINSHHWHWHLVYPAEMDVPGDRKGELFYYMHQQMVARYDMERLSVDLNRVEKLENWRVPISDGYFSKLTSNNSGRAWGTRQDDSLMKDFRRTDFGLEFIDITVMEIWMSRLMDAIHQGYMINRNGDRVPLSDNVTTGKLGIEILGDAFEADASLSPNALFYGDLHNLGHLMIAFTHDNDGAHKEEIGVMGDSATAMRDPVFYRWHKFVDGIFQEYKMTQPPYTLEDVSIVLRRLRIKPPSTTPKFFYHIQVTNSGAAPKKVTVRIFIAPKHNVRGLEMSFMEQRLLWSEMDKFTETLLENYKISVKFVWLPSNVNIAGSERADELTQVEAQQEHTDFRFEETMQQITRKTQVKRVEDEFIKRAPPPANNEFNFCGCGWPEHLLLPRGKPEGMTYQLFVMLTDYEKDKVEEPKGPRKCANAVSFCGILDAKYPDKRPMGFPFDRRPPPILNNEMVTSVADYASLGNISLTDITITFLNNQLKK
nr:hemocyanin F chain-like [Cherax quadricarinatus]